MVHGYAATTMNMIAEAIGGSKATLWAYFDSKDALFRAVVEDLTERFRDDLEDTLIPGRDARKTITGFCEQFLIRLSAPQSVALYRLIIGEGGRFPSISQFFYDRGPQRITERLAAYLQAAVTAGSLRECDPMTAASQLVGLCQTLNVRQLLDASSPVSPKIRRRHVQETADIFLRAYGLAECEIATGGQAQKSAGWSKPSTMI